MSEDDPRSSAPEQITVREMLMLEIHTRRSIEIAQRLVNALGPNSLGDLELIIGDANKLSSTYLTLIGNSLLTAEC